MNDFKQFLSHYPLETYEKGRTILLGGDTPRGVYIVESGLVKTYAISADGEEQLISIDGKEAQVPVGYALGLTDTSDYYYEAYNRCRLRIVPRDEYEHHLRTNVSSLYMRHVRLLILLMSTFDRIKALEQQEAGNKVAYTLLYMAGRVGVLLGRKRGEARIVTTQREIASLLGLSRETTNAELKRLQLKKLIRYSRKNYTLYTNKIEKYIEEQEK